MLRRIFWQTLYVICLLSAGAIGFVICVFGVLHIRRLTHWAWLEDPKIAGVICLACGAYPAIHLLYHFARQLPLPLDLGTPPSKGFPVDAIDQRDDERS